MKNELDMSKLQKNMREAKFLKRMAEYRTMEEQVNGVDEKCQKLRKDVRDTFHVVGTEKKGDKTILHIVTSGREGEESARQTLTEVAEAKDMDIENKSMERYDEKKDREKLVEEIKALLDDLFPNRLK